MEAGWFTSIHQLDSLASLPTSHPNKNNPNQYSLTQGTEGSVRSDKGRGTRAGDWAVRQTDNANEVEHSRIVRWDMHTLALN